MVQLVLQDMIGYMQEGDIMDYGKFYFKNGYCTNYLHDFVFSSIVQDDDFKIVYDSLGLSDSQFLDFKKVI